MTVQSRPLHYECDGVKLVGHLAYDDVVAEGRPVVLVLPEWWGVNAHARKRAEMFAGLGYVAVAVDLYGGGFVAETPDAAAERYTAVMSDVDGVGVKRIMAAKEALCKSGIADCGKVAVAGFCFGGTLALHLARRGTPFDAFVSFHGNYETSTPAQSGEVTGPILVCDGSEDQLRSPESVDALVAEFEAASASLTFISYPGAQHAFTNPDADEKAKKFGLPLAYDQVADEQSWADATKFLAAALA